MAVNVSGTVQIGGVSVSAQVETHGVNATATVQRSNTAVSASVEHRSANVSATAQTRNTNVCASVNPHIMPGGTSDHAQLQNLDYDNAGHTGFQRELIPDESITIDEEGHIHANGESYSPGQNISIDENNVISAVDTTYTQGNGITIDQDNVISNDIYPLVPAQATINNQLADKDFVNSSIATSTATFRGTYNVVTDLHLSTLSTHQQVATALGNTISVADNNDYCFVEIPTDDLTPTETLQVDRYKYNGSSWSFEYTLNNSGYTSAQWKAINSGITSGKVTQYDGYATSKQDTLTAGTNITILNDVISAQIPPTAYPTVITGELATGLNVRSNVGDGGSILLENGFVWNMSGNPTTSDNKVLSALGVGNETGFIPTANLGTYYIKSFARNANGTTYGQEITKTVGTPITVDTLMEMYMLLPLPSGYRRLDYVQTNGSSYIATHWTYYSTAGQYVNIRCKFQLVEQTANYQAIYGAYNAETSDSFRLITSTTSSNSLLFNSKSRANSTNTVNLVDKYALLEVAQNYDGISVKSVNDDITISATHTSGNNITNIIFIGSNGSQSNLANIKFYGFYIDSNREYNNIYIPCIRDVGLTPGMYNPTNNNFYANGTLIAGNYVDEPVLLNGQICYCNETQQSYRYNGTTWVLQS